MTKTVQLLAFVTLAVLSASFARPQQLNTTASRTPWQVHEEKATALLMAGHPDAATEEYLLAITLAPKQPDLHEELGDALWASSRMTDAAPAYEAELALSSQSWSSMFKLGSLEVIRSNPAAGVILLRHALAIDPSLTVARYYLARGEAALGQTQDALSDLKAVVLKSTDESVLSMTWYQLGVLNRRLGNKSESQRAIANFREIKERKDLAMSMEHIVPEDRKRELPRRPPTPM